MESKACLKVTDSFGVRRTVPLLKPVFTIGRKVDSDLHIMSTSVSRIHGEIVLEDGIFYLVDKGSKSGVFLNGQRIDRTALTNLDQISLGGADDYQIQFLSDQISQQSSIEERPSASGEHHSAATAKEKLKMQRNSFLNEIAPPLTAEKIYEAALRSDEAAREVFTETGRWLGLACANLINLLNLEMIIIGGGVMASGEVLLRHVVQAAGQYAFASSFSHCQIVQSKLWPDAGMIGAALLARDR